MIDSSVFCQKFRLLCVCFRGSLILQKPNKVFVAPLCHSLNDGLVQVLKIYCCTDFTTETSTASAEIKLVSFWKMLSVCGELNRLKLQLNFCRLKVFVTTTAQRSTHKINHCVWIHDFNFINLSSISNIFTSSEIFSS